MSSLITGRPAGLAVLSLLALLPWGGWELASMAAGVVGDQPYVEEVSVRLVLLQASVLDRRGEPVPGLGPEDFQVAEDSVPQKITVFGHTQSHPLKIAFLLDVSGSMANNDKLYRARKAIWHFVDRLRPEDQVALLVFADGDVVVRQAFTTDRQLFLETLAAQEAYGRTALRDALAYAPTMLADTRPGRKALVVVTDGIDNASEMTAWEAIRTARRVHVPIYIIGLTDLPSKWRSTVKRPERGRTFFEVLGEFSQETGGEMWPVFRPQEIDSAIVAVGERLRAQYVIGYHPSRRDQEPGFRRIRLATTESRYQVHTRQGYYVNY